MNKIIHSFLILCLLLVFATSPVEAQNEALPTYIVQPGDTLYTIASQFGLTQDELLAANELINPDFISIGQSLRIPGLSGVQGILTTYTANLGEDFNYITLNFKIDPKMFVKLNHLTSASEIYVGSSLIVPVSDSILTSSKVFAITDSNVLSFSASIKDNPWRIKLLQKENSSISFPIRNSRTIIPSELYTNMMLEDEIVNHVSITPLPIIQGSTVLIKISSSQPIKIIGKMGNSNLNFFSENVVDYIALQGISAISETGLIPFEFNASLDNGSSYHFSQSLLVEPMYFFSETLQVDPLTIDPDIVRPEEEFIRTIISNVSTKKYWTTQWNYPTLEPDCIFSRYGNRRTYNGSDYTSFHAGIDYSTCYIDSLDIYAAAPGTVVYSDFLTVRGYSTFIDHGWGIYSAYFHQAETYVNVGEYVNGGQLIGKIGDTGRVTGPHLHFEIWVNGVQVNPEDWLKNLYP